MLSKNFILLLERLLITFGFFIIFGGCCVWDKYKYPETLEEIKNEKIKFIKSYNHASSTEEKENLYKEIQNYLHQVIPNKVLPAWYGTPWSFNGDAEYPLDGTIACGFFVVNVLRNCNFNINTKMAIQPSENIIKNLIPSKYIKRFSNISIETLKSHIQKMGEGIYIIGLDTHVGFILNLNDKIRFTHARGYLFVLSEYPNISPTLLSSDYIVFGKLFEESMIEKWLLNQEFLINYDYFKKKK